MALYLKKDLRAGNPGAAGIQLFPLFGCDLSSRQPCDPPAGVPNLDSAVIEQRKAQLGIDQPFLVQYLQWLGRIVRGDLGLSFDSARRPVADLIKERMPATITLSLASIILGWGIGIPVGILSARYQYSILDYLITFFAFVGISIPSFFFGLILLYVFALKLNVLPAGGFFLAGR